MNEYDIRKIEDCLGRYPIVIAYLFGSEAKGSSGLHSDIDIAVYVRDNIDKPARFDLRLRLSSELSSLVEKRIDLVVLNDLPSQLAYEIIRHGRVILCSDRLMKVEVEVAIMSRYLDRRYYDKRHAELNLQKIASGGLLLP